MFSPQYNLDCLRNKTYLFTFTYCFLSNTALQKNKLFVLISKNKIVHYLIVFYIRCVQECINKFVTNLNVTSDTKKVLAFSWFHLAWYKGKYLIINHLLKNEVWQIGKQGSISPMCLRAAFTPADPESAKKIVKLSSFFALLGSVCVKAACRMLVKLTPGDNPKAPCTLANSNNANSRSGANFVAPKLKFALLRQFVANRNFSICRKFAQRRDFQLE